MFHAPPLSYQRLMLASSDLQGTRSKQEVVWPVATLYGVPYNQGVLSVATTSLPPLACLPYCRLKTTKRSTKFKIKAYPPPLHPPPPNAPFALAFERISIKMQSPQSRFLTGFGKCSVSRHLCMHFSAQKMYRLGQ